MIASGLPASGAVLRERYLQLVTPTSTTIVWQTDLSSAADSRVQYGTGSDNLNQIAFETAVIPPSSAAVKIRAVTFLGLSPSTKYFYNVGTVTDGGQGVGSPDYFFVTEPTVGSATSFRVWLLGDSGTGSIAQQRVRDAMLAETGGTPPNLILHARDIAYQDGNNHSPSPQGVENGY